MSGTAFILGGGPRVGVAVANHLAAAGWKVAVGRRNDIQDGLQAGIKGVRLDVSDRSSITSAFKEVKASFGAAPNVVIYNAGKTEKAAPKDDIFSNDVETLHRDAEVNIWGVYTTLQETTRGWSGLTNDISLPKVFIVTGNILPFAPIPRLLSLGIGKTAAAHMIESATLVEEFQKKHWRFYFATGTTVDGGPVYTGLDGPAHAKAYSDLIERSDQGPWDVRFVAHTLS